MNRLKFSGFKNICFIYFFLVYFTICCLGNINCEYKIIPSPKQIKYYEKELFDLNYGLKVFFPEIDCKEFRYIKKELENILYKYDYRIIDSDVMKKTVFQGIYIGTYKKLKNKLDIASVKMPCGNESYIVNVNSNSIYIIGNTPKGVLYGLETFKQMVSQSLENGTIHSLEIKDWPDFEFRAVYIDLGQYISPVTSDSEDKQNYAKWDELTGIINNLISYKFNKLYVSSEWHFVYSDIPQNFKNLIKLSRMCEERLIDLIPEFQGLGHASGHTYRYPNFTEATWYQDEPIILNQEVPSELRHPNVVITDNTNILVKDVNGCSYKEGLDYVVLAGETKWPFENSNKPYMIARLSKGNIEDGKIVLVSYDAVKFQEKWDQGYCPSEKTHLEKVERPIVHKYMETFRPEYVSIGRDETRVFCQDSRCLKSGKKPYEIFAEDVTRISSYIKEVDPNVKIMIFFDMLAGGLTLADLDYKQLTSSIPKSLIPIVWVYEDDRQKQMADHSEFFLSQGFDILAGPFRSRPVNIAVWRETVNQLRKKDFVRNNIKISETQKARPLGFIFFGWNQEPFMFEEMAESSW